MTDYQSIPMEVRWADESYPDDAFITGLLDEMGGPGSGFFKHIGIHGHQGGSQPGGQGPAEPTVLSRAIGNAVFKVHEQGLKDGVEHGILLDANGNEIASVSGDAHHVIIQGRDARKAAAYVHNHPSSTSFSDNDMRMYFENDGMKYIAAIGANGDMYLMGKGKNFDKWSWGHWYDAWDKSLDTFAPEYDQALRNGVPREEALRTWSHQVNTMFAGIMGVDYRKVEMGVDYGR